MSEERQRLGREGEALAERHLIDLGYRLLARRFRCRYGEIDLIFQSDDVVIFVEVKARSGLGYGTPAASVTLSKRRMLARAAQWFLSRQGWLERPCRFDVVELLDLGGQLEMNHIQGAFNV